MTHTTTTQHNTRRHNIMTHNNNTTQDATQDAQPSIYNADGKIDITARRNAIIARMKETNAAQQIWDVRMGC